MEIKEVKHQIEITAVATDHRLIRDRWLNIKRILDAIYKELSPLKNSQQTISINKNSLPIEQKKLFESVLEKMLEDGIVDYYNSNDKIQVVTTSDQIRKFLRGEDIIIKDRNVLENYRKEISELYDFIEKDGRKRFPEVYNVSRSGYKKIRNKKKIIISIISIVFIFIFYIMGGINTVFDFYDRFIKKDYQEKNINWIENINLLSAGVDLTYFIDILGNPTFINNKEAISESIFVNDDFYIQAYTDNNKSVLAYSVTTRKKSFNPEIKLGPYSSNEEVKIIQLGKSKFIEIGDPEKITSYNGAHNFYYSEEYYFGNPGNYQSYIFSLNESGYLDIEYENDKNFYAPPYVDKYTDNDDIATNEEIKQFRNNAIINTYTITAPFVGINNLLDGLEFGPDYNQVRILKK